MGLDVFELAACFHASLGVVERAWSEGDDEGSTPLTYTRVVILRYFERATLPTVTYESTQHLFSIPLSGIVFGVVDRNTYIAVAGDALWTQVKLPS